MLTNIDDNNIEAVKKFLLEKIFDPNTTVYDRIIYNIIMGWLTDD